jgi:hypothetical protein
MAYFKYLTNVIYPTLRKEKNSSHDYTKIKNLFRRAYIPDEILKIYTAFEDYEVQGDDRPDNVSQKYYDNPTYDWIIFITNNIQNVRSEWPMTQSDLNNYLLQKYTENELSQVHHYETIEIKNSIGNILLKPGIKVKEDYIFKYTETINGITQTFSYNPVVEITNYEYEVSLNDDKRRILMLRPDYVKIVEREMVGIFRHKPSSSFVDEFTIKVEDPCIPSI